MDDDPILVRTFRFRVSLHRSGATKTAWATATSEDHPTGAALGDGAFQECSGLQIEMDVNDYNEGGRNNGVIRRMGRAKYQAIVLKRGMFHPASGTANGDLWRWLQDTVNGVKPVRRYDGIIEVLSPATQRTVAEWVFDRGLPARIVGPTLNALTGEVALEELHIAHEGLFLAGGA